MGNFSETLSNLGMFKQIEEDLVDLIKCSLIDNGKKVENDFNLKLLCASSFSAFRSLRLKAFLSTSTGVVSIWACYFWVSAILSLASVVANLNGTGSSLTAP